MTQIRVALTDEQMAATKALARERRLWPAEFIREEVAALLRSTGDRKADERRRRALGVAGRFRSGRGNLAHRHDEYLAEEPQ